MTTDAKKSKALDQAKETLDEYASQQTDGNWLEELTVEVAPLISEWDVEICYPWADWPERKKHFPKSTAKDLGNDRVAVRKSDGALIAIQCKARQLDESGVGGGVDATELAMFLSASSNPVFAERWLVTNGAVPLGANAVEAIENSGKPMKLVNLGHDLAEERSASDTAASEEPCPHCKDPNETQTRSCMQREAVEQSVELLREHAETDSGGLPKGQARGRIILPCGSGKTRVALRILEELTGTGELSVVLCPSIALVAQLRREFLQHACRELRTMAVCSDTTAGYSPAKEGQEKRLLDPTQDNSHVSESEVKGFVTTDSGEIAKWIKAGRRTDSINVIFGTYQSAGRVSEALKTSRTDVQVLVCDEAHRTASLTRRKAKDDQARLSRPRGLSGRAAIAGAGSPTARRSPCTAATNAGSPRRKPHAGTPSSPPRLRRTRGCPRAAPQGRQAARYYLSASCT